MAKKYTKRKSIRKSRTKKSKTKYRRRHRSNRKSSRKAIRVKLNTHRGGSGQKYTGNPFSRTAKYAWNPKHKTRRLNVEERAEKLDALGKKKQLTIQTLFEYTPFLVTTEDGKYRFHILEKLDSGREFDGYTNKYIEKGIDEFSGLGDCTERISKAIEEAEEARGAARASEELEKLRKARDEAKVLSERIKAEEARKKVENSAVIKERTATVVGAAAGVRGAAIKSLLEAIIDAKGNIEEPVKTAAKSAMES